MIGSPPPPSRAELSVIGRVRCGWDEAVNGQAVYWHYRGVDRRGRQWTWYEKEINGIFAFWFGLRWHITAFKHEEWGHG